MSKVNPCTKCYFDWKDFCDHERIKKCTEIYNQKKQQEEANEAHCNV